MNEKKIYIYIIVWIFHEYIYNLTPLDMYIGLFQAYNIVSNQKDRSQEVFNKCILKAKA